MNKKTLLVIIVILAAILAVGILFAVHLSANTKPLKQDINSTDGISETEKPSQPGAGDPPSAPIMEQPTVTTSTEIPTDAPIGVPTAPKTTDPADSSNKEPTEHPEGEDSTQSSEEATTEPTKPEYDPNAGALPIMPMA